MRIKIGPNPSEFPRNLPIANIRKKGASISNEAAISLGRGGASDLWIIIKINPVIIATRDNPIRNDLIPSCFQPGGRCEFWYEPLSHLVMVLCIFPSAVYENCINPWLNASCLLCVLALTEFSIFAAFLRSILKFSNCRKQKLSQTMGWALTRGWQILQIKFKSSPEICVNPPLLVKNLTFSDTIWQLWGLHNSLAKFILFSPLVNHDTVLLGLLSDNARGVSTNIRCHKAGNIIADDGITPSLNWNQDKRKSKLWKSSDKWLILACSYSSLHAVTVACMQLQ